MAVLRQPPRTPVRRSPRTSSQAHKKFSEDDSLQTTKLVAETPAASQPEPESESDSDEAPEEEGLAQAAEKSVQQEREREKLEREINREQKELRRKRQAVLVAQKQESTQSEASTFLPDELLSALENEALAKQQQASEPKQKPRGKHSRLDKLSKPKSIFHKGPVTVKILDKSQRLAPTHESVVTSVRDRLLHRRSVRRK